MISHKTPILEEAERKGNHIYNGLDMFAYQGWWKALKFGTKEDADINLHENSSFAKQLKGE